MKKLNNSFLLIQIFLISSIPSFLFAQITGQCSNCPLDFPSNAVNGVLISEIEMPAQLSDDLGVLPLISVCFDLTHDWLGDLYIVLESPSGKLYFLMGDENNNQGGCGSPAQNANVCFVTGSDNPLTNGENYGLYCGTDPAVCLSGDWTVGCGIAMVSDMTPGATASPNCDLNDFNESGDLVSGIWRAYLGCVCGIGEFAYLNNWSLTFQTPTAILPCTGPPTTNAGLIHQPCENDVLRFAAADGVAYEWEGPNGFQSTTSEIALNDFSENLAGMYTCKIVTAQNCYDLHSIEVKDICQKENHSIYLNATKEFCVEELLAFGLVDESTNNNFLEITASGNCMYVTNLSPGVDSIYTLEKIGNDELYTRYIIEAMGVSSTNESFPAGWELSPNPTSGQLLLKTPNTTLTKISILDMTGKTLMVFQPEAENNVLHLSALANGVYTVSVESGSGRYFERVALMK